MEPQFETVGQYVAWLMAPESAGNAYSRSLAKQLDEKISQKFVVTKRDADTRISIGPRS